MIQKKIDFANLENEPTLYAQEFKNQVILNTENLLQEDLNMVTINNINS